MIHQTKHTNAYTPYFLLGWLIFTVCPIVVLFNNIEEASFLSCLTFIIIGVSVGSLMFSIRHGLKKFTSTVHYIDTVSECLLFYCALKIFVFPNIVGEVEDFRFITADNNIFLDIIIICAAIFIAQTYDKIKNLSGTLKISAIILPLLFTAIIAFNDFKKPIPALSSINVAKGSTFIFINDMASGPVFYDLLRNDEINQSTYKDFNIYLNTTTPGTRTSLSLPHMFSGLNLIAENADDLRNKAIENNAFQKFPELEKTLLVKDNFPTKFCEQDSQFKCVNYASTSEKTLKTLRISFARILPPIKVIFDGMMHSFDKLDEQLLAYSYKKDRTFKGFDFIKTEKTQDTTPGIFILYSTTTHIPFRTNAECTYDTMHTLTQIHQVKETHKCAAHVFDIFIQHLKNLGLYDSSTLIFTSDHGPYLRDPKDTPKSLSLISEPYYDMLYNSSPRTTNVHSRFWPMLMVKYPNASYKSPQLDMRSASLLDIMPTVCSVMDEWCENNTFDGLNLLSDTKNFENRTRYIMNAQLSDLRFLCDPIEKCFLESRHMIIVDPDLKNLLETNKNH